jgi:hypothetical protein
MQEQRGHNTAITMMLLALSAVLALLAHTGALEPAVCTPCIDGSTWNASMMLPNGTSCHDLVVGLAGILSLSDECAALQVTTFQYCGCPVAPPQGLPSFGVAVNTSATCTICPDGSDVAREVVIPTANMTCGSAQELAAIASDEDCLDFQTLAAWCQCPDIEPMCTLCPDGSSPLAASYEIPGLDGMTCGDLEFIATTLDDILECEAMSDLRGTCDCPSVDQPSCTLCDNGLPSLFPNAILPNGDTCQEVEELASNITSDYCHELKMYAASFCGCVLVDNHPTHCASVCPDGSPISVPFLGRVVEAVNGVDITCAQLEGEVENGLSDQERCMTYAYIGIHFCGCAKPVLARSPCTLCENTLPPPSLFSSIDNSGYMCGDFAALAETITDDPRRCTALQGTAGIACGCENPVADGKACRLCDDGLLPDTGRVADPQEGISCAETEFFGTMAKNPYVCRDLQQNYGPICCDDPQPAEAAQGPLQNMSSGVLLKAFSLVIVFTPVAMLLFAYM